MRSKVRLHAPSDRARASNASIGARGYNLRALPPGLFTASRPSPWRDIVAPLALALGLRALLVALTTSAPSWDGVIYVRAAEQLARGEGYTQRILHEGNPPHPTAFYPVGYPAVLALVRLLGGGLGSDLGLQVACGVLVVPIAYLLARRAAGRPAGRCAAWLAATWPGGIFLSVTWLAEPLFALGAGLSLLPLAYARRARRTRALLLAALGLGMVAYLRASALPMVACVGLLHGVGWLRRSPALRVPLGSPTARRVGAVALAGAMGVLACVPLAPWVARNARLLGAPVLVSTNDGVNLLLGARGEGSFANLPADEPCKRGGLREVERSRCYTRQALSLIASDPLAAGARALLKLAHTYGHDSAPAQCFADGLPAASGTREAWRLWSLGLCRVAWLLIFSGAVVGGLRIARRGDRVLHAVLLGPIVALGLLHMTFLGGDRYHAAVAPMLLALAGVAIGRRKPRSAALGRSDTLSPDRLEERSPASPA